jgi:hypothetical protein
MTELGNDSLNSTAPVAAEVSVAAKMKQAKVHIAVGLIMFVCGGSLIWSPYVPFAKELAIGLFVLGSGYVVSGIWERRIATRELNNAR